MIVKKDDYSLLPAALQSIRQSVDEVIIVVDEIDQDIESIAQKFDVRLVENKFNDNFAEQRNISLQYARMEWMLVMDADEVMSSHDLVTLKRLAATDHYVAFVMSQLNYTNDVNQARFIPAKNDITEKYGFAGYFPVPTIRFIRNNQGITFTRRVHEMVDESLESKGLLGRVLKTDISLHHLKGIKGPVSFRLDELRYLRLLKKEAKDNPKNPKVFFDIGTISLFTAKNIREAILNLKKAVKLNPQFLDANLNLAFAYGEAKEYENALAIYQSLPPSYTSLSGITASLFFLGRHDDALESAKKTLSLFPEKKEEIEKKIAAISEAKTKNKESDVSEL